MTQRHNLRQRKNLHLGEFQELGFYIDLAMLEKMPDHEIERFIDAFLVEIIEPRNIHVSRDEKRAIQSPQMQQWVAI